ncbi:unnamed protein product [Ambrosiozyma monospora]|uniref:Unnamed protein product n=1 Tax=Ambrosiozyma monospora TaxID=43982 RepID=A0A9W6TAK3_AMBMO|nr:unnamed protein product [Ambrosiozyma monospora]
MNTTPNEIPIPRRRGRPRRSSNTARGGRLNVGRRPAQNRSHVVPDRARAQRTRRRTRSTPQPPINNADIIRVLRNGTVIRAAPPAPPAPEVPPAPELDVHPRHGLATLEPHAAIQPIYRAMNSHPENTPTTALPHSIGRLGSISCIFCNAMLFPGETQSFCCRNGGFEYDSVLWPVALYNLFNRRDNGTLIHPDFVNNILKYNNALAPASAISSDVVPATHRNLGNGPMSYHISGSVVHYLPVNFNGTSPTFGQFRWDFP